MLLATAITDPPAVACAAAVFTLFAGRSIARAAQAGKDARLLEERRHAAAGAAVGLWFALCAGYHAFAFPAWMLCYVRDPLLLPAEVWYPVFGLTLMAAGALAAHLTQRLLARRELRAARLLAAGLFALWVLFSAFALPRLRVVGSFEEFQRGAALPLLSQPAVRASLLLACGAAVAGLGLAVLARVRYERRRDG